jgi:hypothetical protein
MPKILTEKGITAILLHLSNNKKTSAVTAQCPGSLQIQVTKRANMEIHSQIGF